MQAFEDPYKSEGVVQLTIQKLSQFARGESVDHNLRSDAIHIRGLSWKLLAKHVAQQPAAVAAAGDNEQAKSQQKFLGCYLECDGENEDIDSVWSCNCSATLKLLARKEGNVDFVRKYSQDFNAKSRSWGWAEFISFKDLMNPAFGLYDEASDSATLQAHIAADAPHGIKSMPEKVYQKYSIRSEHSLFVESKGNKTGKTTLWIEDKSWEFNYSSNFQTLNLEMSLHSSDCSKTVAECIFWYWNYKKIVILQKCVQTFEKPNYANADATMKTLGISVATNGVVPANKKFNVLIRLLDERNSEGEKNNSLDSYYGDNDGIETVILSIVGTKEASFVVPKIDLIRASPVFNRMFANEMMEKKTGKVVIEDTNPEEFGDFLKAISPKQEHPTPSNVFALLKLADRYQCQLLRNRCEAHLMNCVEIPLIHLINCANSYELAKLKKNLLLSFDKTGLFKLHRQMKPYLGILNGLTKMMK